MPYALRGRHHPLLAGLARPLALCAALLVGCGGDSGPRHVGAPDDPGSRSLRVDEAGLRADVVAGALEVRIPVKNLTGQAINGKLQVTLAGVDGQPVLQRLELPYAVDGWASATLTAGLSVPADVSGQADWVRYSLRLEGSGTGSLRVTRSLLALVPPHEVRLEGPTKVTRGRKVTYRVRAEDPVRHQSLAGVPVELIIKKGDVEVAEKKAMTGERGDAVFELVLDVEGDVKVEARSLSQGTSASVEEGATVTRPGARVLLTTDKPIYQPGQTIHLRALALDGASGTPVAGQPAVFEIEDGKGNKILKRTLTTDQYGLGATTFRLGPVLNMGTFKVRVAVGPDRTEKTVEVSRYALPKFKLDVATARPYYLPGDVVSGTVDARYFFGKSVADAEVTIEASALDIGASVFKRLMGRTDAQGRFPFEIALPEALVGLPLQQGSALVTLDVKVVDSAGQQVKRAVPVTVSPREMRLALVPEATVLVPGLANQLDLFASDPLGAPVAGAKVELVPSDGEPQSAVTDAFGHATFSYVPGTTAGNNARNVVVNATAKDGEKVTESFNLTAQTGAASVLVRTDRAVYGLGETVAVEVRTSSGRSSVYVDWVNNGQTVDMRTLEVKDGVARFQMPIDTGLLGSSRIEAYVVNATGNLVRAGRTIFARKEGGLEVELTSDQPQYTPGSPAQLTFSVKDEKGAPAVAALGVQIVDEAVFALVDARPGLLRTYFELEQSFSQPHYQIRAPVGDLTQLLLDETSAADPAAAGAAQTRAAATLAAIGTPFMGIQKGSFMSLAPEVSKLLAPSYEAEKKRLAPAVNGAAAQALQRLLALGCRPTEYYCQKAAKSFGEALRAEVAAALELHDFWGNRYREDGAGSDEALRLGTAGPDETMGNADDGSIHYLMSEVGLPSAVVDGVKRGGATDNAGAGAVPGGGAVPVNAPPGLPQPSPPPTAGGAGGASGNGGGAAEPRVRQDFPETLYVNPQVITGPDGKAQLKVDLADSITSWRVSTLAHTAGGKLGGGLGAVKVFQDFFVDIDFPATLTRGDELDFPVAIYNYLDRPQTIQLELAAGNWYTPRGPTTVSVPLAAGQVTGVRFPVRVERVGRQSLTVKALGETRSDAVARTVLVEPDGKAVPVVRSGSLPAGELKETITFPEVAIAGSQKLTLDVYPAFLSQVVQGMDSLLRVPNGCFEQTTSTAWPNVLVTEYLKETKQLKPEVALKAESLMSAGYQRLLTFEHKGGGFSWFGEQDGAPYLSVTAFGLMEFSDMARVHDIDERMLERTKQWLVNQQSSDGSWKGDMSEFFSFHTSLVRNTAFVVWALASSGYSGSALERGLAYVKQQLSKEKLDAYSLAIAANAFLTVNRNDPTVATLLSELAGIKKEEGDKVFWDSGATQTNFYGGGDDAKVATTALVVHALLLAGADKPSVDRGLAYLTGSRDSRGNFGSTQATIWTLRTLLLATRKGTDGAVGQLSVDVDGQPFGNLALTADQADVMTTLDFGPRATTGEHIVTLRFMGTGKVSYNLVAQHHIPWTMMPAETGPVAVEISYDKTKLAVDEIATARVKVRNTTRSPHDMVMVTVGLPPGFEVLTEDLEKYVTERKLSRYELTGKQLMLYVSKLAAAATLDLTYRLRATMPVKAADGGAQAFLYYQPKQKTTAPATTLEVVAAVP